MPIVMHGSSSVPRKRSSGSTPPAANWIPAPAAWTENEYLPAAKLGVTKVNIDTDGRLVWTRVHREFFRDKPAEFDFRPPGKIFMEEYAKLHRAQEREARLGRSTGRDPGQFVAPGRCPPKPGAREPRVKFTLQELATLSAGELVGDGAQAITGAAPLADAIRG